MDTIRHIQLRWLQGTLADVTVRSIQLWRATPHTWQPAINAFRCEAAVSICVDLAGIAQSMIDLRVEPRRITVRGSREAPEPTDQAVQMLALEIDYGPFERVIELPAEVSVKNVRAEQENGLLWIYLPLKR
jgi:HSP20 family protein